MDDITQPETIDLDALAERIISGPMLPPGGWHSEEAREMLGTAVLTMLHAGFSVETIGQLCQLIMQSVFSESAAKNERKIILPSWGIN